MDRKDGRMHGWNDEHAGEQRRLTSCADFPFGLQSPDSGNKWGKKQKKNRHYNHHQRVQILQLNTNLATDCLAVET